MSWKRTITLDYGRSTPTEVVYVMGTQLFINLDRNAPPRATSFDVKCSSNVTYFCLGASTQGPVKIDTVMYLMMDKLSKGLGDEQVKIQLYDQNKKPLASAELRLTAVEISLDVDADQDGKVEKNNRNKASWKWGPNGHGAILLVNCDLKVGKRPEKDKSAVPVEEVSKDMSPMLLRTAGPPQLPKGYRLKLHMSLPHAKAAQVFIKSKGDACPLVLDEWGRSQEIVYTKETTFYVMGVKFADKDFNGLVRIHVSLLQPGEPETPVFTDTVQFRMTPWIMTPNPLQPVEVFVCSVDDNKKFLDGMTDLVKKAMGKKPYIVPKELNRGDRWIQDEIAFGYIEAPHKQFPVVVESPREGPLKDFAIKLLGPDFGYWTMFPPRDKVTSLESFGNLEVSPPVTVNGKNYPMGRLIIGGSFSFERNGRDMTNALIEFLRAQIVQEPIVLFSDWLTVGHVDEFLAFVPAKDRKGFRLLLASPQAAYKLCLSLKEAGHGKAKFFEDVPSAKKVKTVTVDEVLANTSLRSKNDYYQRCIDWNRDCLKNELGLDEEDIVDLPVLYQPAEGMEGAHSYYPNLVNMIVLGQYLGIAKPFGPKVNGKCALEQEVTRLLGNLGFKCNFIDDVVYYEKLGDVHCGSNVRRMPFDLKWWKMEM